MTDIPTTAPITIRRLDLPRPRFPRLGIGALLVEAFGLIGEAVCMAYVGPYASRHRQRQIVPDEDLGGRDPSW